MPWQALQALALAHGRRLSWRDLRAWAHTVPNAALPEAAVLAMQAHGLAASTLHLDWHADTGRVLPTPLAARMRSGDWLALLANRPDAQGDQEVQVQQWHDAPEEGLGEPPPTSQWWSMATLAQRCDGLCIQVPVQGDAMNTATSVQVPTHEQDVLSEPSTDSASASNWFWQAFRPLRGHYGDCVLAAVLINLLALVSSMFSMNVYDRIIPTAAMHSLWTLGVGVLLAAVVELGLRSLRAGVLDDAGKRADLVLSSTVFRQLLNLRPVDRPASSGQWVSQLRDFDAVRDFVSSTTLVTLTDLPFAVLFLAVMFWIGGPLAWITLAAGVLTVLVGVFMQWPIRRSVERYQHENTQKHAFMIETLERLETIDALGAGAAIQGRWERLCAAASRSAMVSRMASALTSNSAQFIGQLANVALIVAGVYLILAGQLTVGALIGTSILASRVLSPLAQVAGLLARWQNTRMSFGQMHRLMQLPLRQDPLRTFVAWPFAHNPMAPKGEVAPGAVDLSVQQLRFRYPRTQVDVLQIDALTLHAGECVAVTGAVGSGKSTLLRVLAGLQWPTEGQVLAAGVAASQISPAEWRAHVAWVGQDAVLFRGSLRDNLLLGGEQVSDARLLHVLRLCGLDRLAAAHPQGLDMPLGEGGQALSGGQRQWVALARALLAQAPVVLLDEPTSAMDMGFEKTLLERLRAELQGRTVVICTHRPGPLALAQRLLVLDAGRVVADGPTEQVLQALAQGQVQRAAAMPVAQAA